MEWPTFPQTVRESRPFRILFPTQVNNEVVVDFRHNWKCAIFIKHFIVHNFSLKHFPPFWECTDKSSSRRNSLACNSFGMVIPHSRTPAVRNKPHSSTCSRIYYYKRVAKTVFYIHGLVARSMCYDWYVRPNKCIKLSTSTILKSWYG